MQLPTRLQCFACRQTARSTVWSSAAINLIACANCGSEWLEGHYPGEAAYSYADYETDPLMERYHIARARRFANYFREFAEGRDLLDVGCGTGEFCLEANKLGWNAVGTELTEETAAIARAKTGLPIISGNIGNTGLFKPSSFDVITLWGVLEHVADTDALLRACLPLVRPNGLILLETPNVKGLFRFVAQKLLKMTLGHFEKPFLETLGAGHIAWYSSRGLQEHCRSLDLQILDLRPSRNYTRILLDRFKHLPLPSRWFFQAATAILNYSAAPLGRPNQIMAALRPNKEGSQTI